MGIESRCALEKEESVEGQRGFYLQRGEVYGQGEAGAPVSRLHPEIEQTGGGLLTPLWSPLETLRAESFHVIPRAAKTATRHPP